MPRKDPDNGYSYYSAAQISSFYFIRAFRDLGCSVADIKDYLLAGEQARFDSFVDVQYAALLRQREVYSDVCTGVFGEPTRRAVLRLQTAESLPHSGIADEALWYAILRR